MHPSTAYALGNSELRGSELWPIVSLCSPLSTSGCSKDFILDLTANQEKMMLSCFLLCACFVLLSVAHPLPWAKYVEHPLGAPSGAGPKK